MAAVEQLSLFDRAEEARAYHDPARAGFFSILVDVNGDKRQSSHRLIEMPTVLELIDKSRDTWLTQAEFIRPNRRVVNLARLGLLFADLDTYRTPWAKGRTPEQLAASVLYHCAQEGIPTPSMLIFSGRGIQAKWLLDGTIPRQALPRWNACQKYLIDRLRPVGADVAAKDASRVLRLVETVNSKSGEICRVVHVENGPDGQPVRYSFEYLAEMLLPVARWTIEQQRQERAERRQLKLLSGAKTDNLRGGVSEGERMQHLFWRLNFLLLSGATHSSQMYYEAKALAGELAPTWAYRDKELMTLYSKAKAYEKGEKISFAGREFAPLYTPKNDTLINLFQITDDEQRELKTIISKGMAAERHKDREADRRRAAGAVDRETYLEAAKTKQAQAQELREQGMTQKQIAEKMGVGLRSVKRYLAEGAKSVRITNGEAHARAVGPAFE